MGDQKEVIIVRASDVQLNYNLDNVNRRIDWRRLSDENSLTRFCINHSARRILPYGIWTCGDGREVVFNREYQPILQRVNDVNSHANRSEWVEDIIKTVYLFNDLTNPFSLLTNKYEEHKLTSSEKKMARKSLLICLDILKKYSPEEGLPVNHAHSVVLSI